MSAEPAQSPGRARPEEQPAQPIQGQVIWEGEPGTLEELTARYEILHKIPARTAGASLFVTKSAGRDGSVTDMCSQQAHKLFLASWYQTYKVTTEAPAMLQLTRMTSVLLEAAKLQLSRLPYPGCTLCSPSAWHGVRHRPWSQCLPQA